jgi:hypothetical protein
MALSSLHARGGTWGSPVYDSSGVYHNTSEPIELRKGRELKKARKMKS